MDGFYLHAQIFTRKMAGGGGGDRGTMHSFITQNRPSMKKLRVRGGEREREEREERRKKRAKQPNNQAKKQGDEGELSKERERRVCLNGRTALSHPSFLSFLLFSFFLSSCLPFHSCHFPPIQLGCALTHSFVPIFCSAPPCCFVFLFLHIVRSFFFFLCFFLCFFLSLSLSFLLFFSFLLLSTLTFTSFSSLHPLSSFHCFLRSPSSPLIHISSPR